jgi:hypothetical protein
MTSPEWQERSLEAASERVRVAREREEAATVARVADEEANAAGEPGGYGRTVPSEQGAKSKTTKSKTSSANA